MLMVRMRGEEEGRGMMMSREWRGGRRKKDKDMKMRRGLRMRRPMLVARSGFMPVQR